MPKQNKRQQQSPKAPADTNAAGEWSGLECDAMKEARCSLLLPLQRQYQPKIKSLPRQRILVYQDKAMKPIVGLTGGKSFYVDFPGCTILQLEPSPMVKHKTMPVTLTVAGRCKFTSQNYRDFGMMMRSRSQAETIDVPPNGTFDWPDVEAFLLCPVCGNYQDVPKGPDLTDDDHIEEDTSPKPDDPEYWMLFYPLLQIQIEKTTKMVIASRTICRLTCMACMQTLLEGMFLTTNQTPTENEGRRPSVTSFQLSVMEILEEAGSASFLQDEPPRPQHAPNVDDDLDAWTLYKLWEHSGAWEALQNDYKTVLSISMQATASVVSVKEETKKPDPPAFTMMTSAIQAKERYGRKCGNPSCRKVHGRKDETLQGIVRLSIVCEKCEAVYYCTKACRAEAADHHATSCANHHETQQKKHESNLKKIPCDVCDKVLPCTQMKKCSRCRASTYCSVECQRRDWIKHKGVCTGTKK
jgi:MYND finger